MKVIGHNDMRIKLAFAAQFGRPEPFVSDDLPKTVEPHLAIDDIAEEAVSIMRADGNEEGAVSGVIKIAKPD